jgi:hypothetical protein
VLSGLPHSAYDTDWASKAAIVDCDSGLLNEGHPPVKGAAPPCLQG